MNLEFKEQSFLIFYLRKFIVKVYVFFNTNVKCEKQRKTPIFLCIQMSGESCQLQHDVYLYILEFVLPPPFCLVQNSMLY